MGGLFSAYGAYQQGKAARNAARYNAQVAENNAKITEYQKADVARQAEDKKLEIRQYQAKLKAQGRTGYAAGNVALGSGSPADFEANIAELAEQDIMDTEYNKKQNIWGLNIEKQNYYSQANLLRTSGDNQYKAGLMGMGTSLLSTGHKFGDKLWGR